MRMEVLNLTLGQRRPFVATFLIFCCVVCFSPKPSFAAFENDNFVNTCETRKEGLNGSPTCLVDRSSMGPIRVIVHGTKHDPFWKQIKAGMVQTAQDLKVDLDLVLFDDDDPNIDSSTLAEAMIQSIQQYQHGGRSLKGSLQQHQRRRMSDTLMGGGGETTPDPSAMIVSLPGNPLIETTLATLSDSTNIPIFGINAVPQNKNFPFLKGSVSMDDTKAGMMAGAQIQTLLQERGLGNDENRRVSGIYINHRSDVESLKDRFNALSEATSDDVDAWEVGYLEKDTTTDDFLGLFRDCKHTVIQLAGGSGIAESVVQALVANGCNIEDDHIIGTFDASSQFVYDAIGQGTIAFAISQQPYLQGSHAILMAVIYATTGQILNGDTVERSPNVPTGPILVNSDSFDLLQPQRKSCELEGYPVCWPGTGPNYQAPCPCTERSQISIAVVTHDDDESSDFWSSLLSGITQAAKDFEVTIQTNAFKKASPAANRERLDHHGRLKHSFDIAEICQSNSMNGLIVSLPDSTMSNNLIGCDSREIPYVVVNAMGGTIGHGEDRLYYVGQRDYESGLEAGKRLINAGVLQGWCLLHANFDTLKERCRGMEEAFAASDQTKYMGIVHVPNHNDITAYKTIVEAAIEENGEWIAHGVLSTGREQIPALLSLLEDHPDMLAATYDMNTSLYEGSSSASRQIVFGINQNAFLEGYLSIASMVWKISTTETPTTSILETGPKFVEIGDQRNECQGEDIQFCTSTPNQGGNSMPAIEEYPLVYSGKCSKLDRKCGVCEGDCNDDTDCGEGLVCFIRDSLTSGVSDPVPGCSTNPYELGAKDFCVDARVYQCKDADQIDVKVGSFSVKHTCAYVKEDMDYRCKQYGRFCRETCGYCRSQPTEVETFY